jgi:hypothetical protein
MGVAEDSHGGEVALDEKQTIHEPGPALLPVREEKKECTSGAGWMQQRIRFFSP